MANKNVYKEILRENLPEETFKEMEAEVKEGENPTLSVLFEMDNIVGGGYTTNKETGKFEGVFFQVKTGVENAFDVAYKTRESFKDYEYEDLIRFYFDNLRSLDNCIETLKELRKELEKNLPEQMEDNDNE